MAQFVLTAMFPSEFLGNLYDGLWRWWLPKIGMSLFHVQVDTSPSGSGDTTYDFLKILVYLVLAALGGLLWTLRDRRLANDERVHAWFRSGSASRSPRP